MRSRYSAFVKDLRDYLLSTWHPSTRPPLIEAPEPDDTNVIDLMEALRNSLKGAAGGTKPAAKKTAKAPAKKKPASRKKAA